MFFVWRSATVRTGPKSGLCSSTDCIVLTLWLLTWNVLCKKSWSLLSWSQELIQFVSPVLLCWWTWNVLQIIWSFAGKKLFVSRLALYLDYNLESQFLPQIQIWCCPFCSVHFIVALSWLCDWPLTTVFCVSPFLYHLEIDRHLLYQVSGLDTPSSIFFW